MRTLSGRAPSKDRNITAAVSTSGLVAELTLTEADLGLHQRVLARAIQHTINAAHRAMGEQAVALSAETFGEDAAVTQRLREEADPATPRPPKPKSVTNYPHGGLVTNRIEIDADILTRHAARVDQVATSVRLAQDAAASMNIAGGAFGLMCAFLVPPALVATTAAKLVLGSTERLLERSTTQLRGAVQDFTTYEDSAVTAIQSLGRGLE